MTETTTEEIPTELEQRPRAHRLRQPPGLYPTADELALSEGTEPTIADLCAILRRPVDPRFLRTIESTGATYVDVTSIVDHLDGRLGPARWEWDLLELKEVGPHLLAVGRLTLHGSDRTASKTAGGSEDLRGHAKAEGERGKAYGGPAENVEATCLRRAAMKFGFCRELWRKVR